jgi:hypothetical protein
MAVCVLKSRIDRPFLWSHSGCNKIPVRTYIIPFRPAVTLLKVSDKSQNPWWAEVEVHKTDDSISKTSPDRSVPASVCECSAIFRGV